MKIINNFKDYLLNRSNRYRYHKSEHTKLEQEVDALNKKIKKLTYPYPPGHFHSPINDLNFLKDREDLIWKPEFTEGIEKNEKEQLNLLKSFSKYYPEIPFKSKKQPELRYYLENNYFARGDGIILYSMMRTLKPKRIVEVGSGFSSALMMDVNDLFFGGKLKLTFIEPNPERLYGLMSEKDRLDHQVIPKIVQDVDLEIFEKLEPDDILFIDSSHVVKTGNDVQHIFFKILPKLKSGVYIHFHDIFYPFEYPKHWILDNRWNWNENYFLKAFLMYNTQFKIVLLNKFICHEENLKGIAPTSSAWLKKI